MIHHLHQTKKYKIGTKAAKQFTGSRIAWIQIVLSTMALLIGFACSSANKNAGNGGGIESITKEDLEGHLSFLASDELEGRDTGTKGLQLAARYIASELQRLKLVPVGDDSTYFQHFDLESRQISLETMVAVIDSANQEDEFYFPDDFFPYPRRQIDNVTLEGEIVFAGYGVTADEHGYNDYTGVDVQNKIVLIMSHEPQEQDSASVLEGKQSSRYSTPKAKITNAEQAGARALLVVTDPNNDHRSYLEQYGGFLKYLAKPQMTLLGDDESEQSRMPFLVVNEKIAEAIFAGSGTSLSALQAQIDSTFQPASFEFPNRWLKLNFSLASEQVKTENVIGLIEGSDVALKEEVIVFSAHYDHVGVNDDGEVYNGADDDGSGVSALLEIAEAYSRAKVKPKRSILFLWFSAEEKGLLGSKYYSENPAVTMDKTIANINIDMVGRSRPRGG